MAAKAAKEGSEAAPKEAVPPQKVCGIVMPISTMSDDYTEDHWNRVRLVLERAIEKAGMRAQLVWENPAVDVIQAAILQNLYENDVVICDVSGLNPNVMLEAGLRLSTRRPTIIVTDRVVKPPFDINTVGYIDYRRDLEYNETDRFIARLAEKITSVSAAEDDGSYRSFVANYRFETVEPSKVSVPAEEALSRKIDELTKVISRFDMRQRLDAATRLVDTTAKEAQPVGHFILNGDLVDFEALGDPIRKIVGENEWTARGVSPGQVQLQITYPPRISRLDVHILEDQLNDAVNSFNSIVARNRRGRPLGTN